MCRHTHIPKGSPPGHWRHFMEVNEPPTSGGHTCHGTCVGASITGPLSSYDQLYHSCKHFVWDLVREYWGSEIGGARVEISKEIRRLSFTEVTRIFEAARNRQSDRAERDLSSGFARLAACSRSGDSPAEELSTRRRASSRPSCLLCAPRRSQRGVLYLGHVPLIDEHASP